MRALLQRVSRAAVRCNGQEVASIGAGLLVFLGVSVTDGEENARALARKVAALRIFPDERGRLNDPLGEREVLCVSQFTLCADTRRGNRPSFTEAAPAERARPLYELFCSLLGAKRGRFGETMEVELVNDGPVTLLLEQ